MCDFFFFKQKTAYEMRISDWSSDVCSSDLTRGGDRARTGAQYPAPPRTARRRRSRSRAGEAIRPQRAHVQANRDRGRPAVGVAACRSEERRVGKESVSTCRSREATDL